MAQNFKKEERKKQIKEATIKLMSERGYKAVSVQNIIDEISYSKSGFYHCFTSKKELLKEIFHDSMQGRLKEISELKVNAFDKETILIEMLMNKVFDYNKYKKLFVTFLFETADNEELSNLYNEGLAELLPEIFIFCDEQDLSEFNKVFDDEFNFFISTLIMGTEIFGLNDNKNYQAKIRKILKAYLDKEKLFKNNDEEKS